MQGSGFMQKSEVMDGAVATCSRILVVEDEPLLRLFNADMLTDAGFDVVEACDAAEALRLLESVSGIRVVFTDVEMPGALDGFALAERIETRWPQIGVVVTSGRRYPNRSFAAPARRFVPKPFRPAQVVEVIGAFIHGPH